MNGKTVNGSLALSFVVGLGIVYHILYHPPVWMQGGKSGMRECVNMRKDAQ